MTEEVKIFNNEQRQHFETMLTDGEYAFVEYRWRKGDLVLMHTVVPEQHEGKGIASALAKFVLNYAREKKLHVIVYCPYIREYMKRHTEYNDLLLQDEEL